VAPPRAGGSPGAVAPPSASVSVGADAPPVLEIGVVSARALRPSAAPALRFVLRIDAAGATVRAVVLGVQLQIAAGARGYGPHEHAQLAGLFGAPGRWGQTLRTLPWLQATVVVPPFSGATEVPLDVPCSYDLDVAACAYLAALGDGEIPLELLFSGTVFHLAADGRLQASRLAWDREATWRLPVAEWRAAVDEHFPGSAWLRLGREPFERLVAFRGRGAHPTWDAAVAALLDAAGEGA
jgi:hypothetical protein